MVNSRREFRTEQYILSVSEYVCVCLCGKCEKTQFNAFGGVFIYFIGSVCGRCKLIAVEPKYFRRLRLATISYSKFSFLMINSIGDDDGDDSRPFLAADTMRLLCDKDDDEAPPAEAAATLGTFPIAEEPTTTVLLSDRSSKTFKTPPDIIERGSVMYCWVPSEQGKIICSLLKENV